MAIRDNFWAHVEVKGPDDCWEWQRSRTRDGYGTLKVDAKRTTTAHRYAFFLTHGREPDGDGMHTCDNPSCCNPAHIVDGTTSENMRDMVRKGRNTIVSLRGERSGRSRVTDRGAVVIKQMIEAGHTHRSVAEYLGLSRSAVTHVMHRSYEVS